MSLSNEKRITVIGAASCLGAQDYRCESAPLVVRGFGLLDRLKSAGCVPTWKHFVLPYTGLPRVNDTAMIAAYCRELAQYVRFNVERSERLAVVGGDHSCAVGTWSGVHAAFGEQPIGLIWVDAHMDSHTPETTHSGALHGMPLAVLLGYGSPSLTQILNAKPKVRPEHVCVLGVRSYEPEEAALLDRLGVRVIYMPEIEQRGLEAVIQEAMAIATYGTEVFGISIDLDAIDPGDAPGVGSPVPGGISGADLVCALPRLHAHPSFVGVEVVEFNPVRDLNERTLRLASRLLLASMTGNGELE